MTVIMPPLMIGNVMTFMTRNTCRLRTYETGLSHASYTSRSPWFLWAACRCLAYGHVFSPPSGGLTDPPTTQLFPAWLAGSPLGVHSIFEEKPEITEDVEEDAALRTDANGAELP